MSFVLSHLSSKSLAARQLARIVEPLAGVFMSLAIVQIDSKFEWNMDPASQINGPFIPSLMSAPNLAQFTEDLAALTKLVAEAKTLVVIDFYASWCPSCRRLSQLLPAIANDFPNVQFLKGDIDEVTELAGIYQITSIPHLKFFKADADGKLVELGSTTGPNGALIREKVAELASKEV
jgi:thioredoxin 1